eukprot:CAMPEP_0172856456 /NCGR_PEP_ID=MMETSP1075-20121228/64054_1 /TAXON_ID=2916 /ORGANISM="Ceratium fusus, Strain PA161109" /LENGTH=85 /DNA_ID=CAMNT_0013703647 /DNA_START=251 /DNA_END=505 /DNA_ORIENTATION=+
MIIKLAGLDSLLCLHLHLRCKTTWVGTSTATASPRTILSALQFTLCCTQDVLCHILLRQCTAQVLSETRMDANSDCMPPGASAAA